MAKTLIGEPWKKQRLLKKEHIPELDQMIFKANQFQYLHEQALFALAYQTAGRISELVRTPYLRKVKYLKKEKLLPSGHATIKVVRNINNSPVYESYENIPINYPGIKKEDLTFTQRKGKNILIVRMANRKNKNFKKKNVPIPVDKEPEFVEILQNYLETLKDEDSLFPFGVRTAERIMEKIGMNPHFLRDIRLTHLVTVYGYNSHQLVRFAGWQNISPAERYVRLSVDDLITPF